MNSRTVTSLAPSGDHPRRSPSPFRSTPMRGAADDRTTEGGLMPRSAVAAPAASGKDQDGVADLAGVATVWRTP